MNKSLIVLVGIVFGLTLLDIVVVETVYRPTEAWTEIWKYHLVYWTLICVLPTAASLKLRSVVPMASLILFFFGVEDTLFYGLQGYLPETFWGVNVAGIWQPCLSTVLVLNVVGLAVATFYVLFAHYVEQLVSLGNLCSSE